MSQGHARKVTEYFDQSFYCSKRFNLRLRAEIVHDLLGRDPKGTLIDLGCGDGSISLDFLSSELRLTCVDLSEAMLERLRERIPEAYRDRVTVIHGDLDAVKEENAYDIVLCLGVLAHVASTEKVIAKIARLLKPRGRCILQLTDSDTLLGKLRLGFATARKKSAYNYGYSLNRTSLEKTLALCREANLQLEGQRKYTLLLPKFSLLPDDFLYRVTRLTLTNPTLSRIGSEAVLCLRKA